MTSPALAPAAGWYTDPADQLGYRWWDGDQWTSHVATPIRPAPIPPPLADSAVPVPAESIVSAPPVLRPSGMQPRRKVLIALLVIAVIGASALYVTRHATQRPDAPPAASATKPPAPTPSSIAQ